MRRTNEPPPEKSRKDPAPPRTVEAILDRVKRPRRVVVTYANGPLHLGHLAGAMLPADIMARYWRLVIGAERVLFVTGMDEHGSTSELPVRRQASPSPTSCAAFTTSKTPRASATPSASTCTQAVRDPSASRFTSGCARRVPAGKLLDKVESATTRIIGGYVQSMTRADYPNLLFEIENYARTVSERCRKGQRHASCS